MKPNVMPMELLDVSYVIEMYERAIREERGQDGTARYPHVEDVGAIAKEFERGVLVPSLYAPGFGAFVAKPVGKREGFRKPKGYIIGRLTTRSIGEPRLIAVAEMIYVDPAFRHHGLSHALADTFWQWGQAGGAQALEAQYVPGSLGEQIWLAAGFRPYLVRTIFADRDWQPRQDMPRRPVVSSLQTRESA